MKSNQNKKDDIIYKFKLNTSIIGNMAPSAAKNTCFKIEENSTYAFSNSANTFDKNLFQVILSEKKNQNIILSSHSVSSVLSMILIGAKVKLVKEWVVKS